MESFIQDFGLATWRLRGTVGDNPKRTNCLQRPMLGVIFYDTSRVPIRVSWMLLRTPGSHSLSLRNNKAGEEIKKESMMKVGQ